MEIAPGYHDDFTEESTIPASVKSVNNKLGSAVSNLPFFFLSSPGVKWASAFVRIEVMVAISLRVHHRQLRLSHALADGVFGFFLIIGAFFFL